MGRWEERNVLYAAFAQFDEEKSGKISKVQVRRGLDSIEREYTKITKKEVNDIALKDYEGRIDYIMLIDRLMKQSQIERELSGRELVVKEVRLSAEGKKMDELLDILNIHGTDINGNRKADANKQSLP